MSPARKDGGFMTKLSSPGSSSTMPNARAAALKAQASHVLARVEKFPIPAPKFTKESWGTGEGGGQD
jgi:hypothetical protein